MLFKEPLFVTKPDLAPLDDFIPYLEEIWRNKRITNKGPFHEEFEQALADFLGLNHLSLFCNGTIALVTALQTLRIEGEVITTPYTFAATAHSLVWNNLEPVFVDIDPITLNIDPTKIEQAITPKTTAILPVHCYGTPCDTEALQNIGDIYGLKILYDAAHAFGVTTNDNSILKNGDLSVLSFHATKVFNTFEGGAIISPDEKTKKRVDFLKNFGFADETTVVAPGINGKMNELQAAFGLLQLNHINDAIKKRKDIAETYRSALENTPGIRVLDPNPDFKANYSYFPIFVEQDFPLKRDNLYEHLKSDNIFSRRYFYPLISDLPMYRELSSASPKNLPVANDLAQKVLCLPIHTDMSTDDAYAVAKVIIDLSDGLPRASIA